LALTFSLYTLTKATDPTYTKSFVMLFVNGVLWYLSETQALNNSV
jgi:hypothetical protein